MPDGGEPAASAAIPFDVAGARAAGYSDGEIANYVGGLTNFNTGAARKAGYADDEIINHLAVQPKVAAPEPPAPETSASGAFVRAAGEQVLPTAGGIAGAYPGAAAGAAIGSVAGPPGAVVGGLVGGLGGFWAGAKAVETVQQGIINRLPTSVQQAIGQDPETRQADEAQHPYATMAGGLAPSLLFLRPGAVEKAAENAPAIAKVMANPIAARVFGAGVNTSLEGIQEQQQGEGYDPVKLGISAASGALLNRETRLGKAVSGAGPAALGRLFPDRPNVQPRPTVDDVVNAPDLDTAINAANQVASGAGPETGAAATPGVPVDIADETSQLATGDSRALQQAALLKLFHNTGAGTVEHTPDGGYQFRTTNAAGAEITHPIEVWNPEEEPDPAAIPTATVDALREHYGQAGVDVVFYKDDGAIPFDGAVDRNQPDTIFLSSNPDRNIAQVAGHEFTHVLQTTTLPDGSSLGDLLNQQIAAGITPAGQRYAAKMFGPTAPSRATFPDDASHAAAVQAHLINELGTDIGGEAPKFQSFLPRVVDAIQARFGDTVAGDVLGKLLDGLQAAMDTVRWLFGDTGTRSQHWVTNLGEIHDTLAQMYAARFGSPVEREQAALAAMRDKAQRDQFVAPEPAPEAPEAPADKTADTGRQAAPATDLWGETRDAQTAKALQLRRWLDQLAAERDAQAAATPRARLLTQTEAAIVRPVGGDETALPPDSKTRLDQVRQQLDEVAHPQADTPEMAKVRDELGATEEALSVAAEPEQPADVARTERRPQFTSEDRDGLLQLPNGQTELGRVPEGLSVPAGSIELRHGWHNEGTNRGTGLLHIEARHGAEIRAAGFHDAAQFVAEVAANYNEIRQDPNGRLFLVQRDMARVRSGDPQAALIVGLVRDGGGWRVETAGRFKSSYINKREMLWQAVHTAAPQPDGMAAPSSAPPTQVSVSEGRLSARDQSEPRLGATQDDVNSHLSDSAAPPGTTPATANALHAKVISQLRADSALQKVLAGDQERGSDQGALETVRKAYRAALGKMLADLAQTDMPALSRFAAAADELRDRAIGTDTVREAREPPKPERPADYGANNKMFTAEAADKAREVLRAKFARLNAGFDPEMMSAGFQLAGFHIEAGARRFSNYARAMTEDLGEGVRPYLAHFYNSVRDFPGFDNARMDDRAAVEAELKRIENESKLASLAENGKVTDDGVQEPLPPRDEGTGTQDVHGTPPDEHAGSAPPGEVGGGPRDAETTAGQAAKGGGRLAEEPGSGAGSGGDRPRDTDRVPAGGETEQAGATGRPDRAPDAEVSGTDFRIAPGAVEEGRSFPTKARDNLAAVELTKRLISEDRPATKAEQAILAKYVGWGGLPGVFPHPKTGIFGKGLEAVGTRLREMLSPEEYRTAIRSTQYAHYTAEHVIRAMWDTVAGMGFKGGTVFEPGMGVGHFLGMMPPELAARSKYEGIEMDALTARIAKLLYPQSGVREADFTRTPLPDNSFDLVIGNPPFSDAVIKSDPKYAARGFMLHDYFFAKSLDAVRPGGLLAFVTSAGTMNKMDAAARHYMAERAEFMGGARLPSSAFRRNAGTDVTTDVLFFRKRPEIAPLNGADIGDHGAWTSVVSRQLPDAKGGITEGWVNRYFSDHPEQVLGQEGFFDKLYQGRYAVQQTPGTDLPTDLRAALDRLPKDVMTEPETPADRARLDFASGQKKEGSFYIDAGGKLMQYSNGAGTAVPRRGAGVEGGFTPLDMDRIRRLVPMRDALRDVFSADLAHDDVASAKARAELNAHYDRFVAAFGPVNKAEFQYRRPTAIQQETARLAEREDARERGEYFNDGEFDPSPFLARNAKTTEIALARQRARAAAEAAGRTFDEGDFDPAAMPDTVIERRPNIKPFMSDPESYRLRSIEKYDDATGTASKRRIFTENILTHEQEPKIASANDGVLWSLNKFGRFDLGEIAAKMNRDPASIVAELGDAVFKVPGQGDTWQTAGEYLSGDVVSKLETARAQAGQDPDVRRNVAALEAAVPPPLAPSEITMTIGMPWLDRSYVQQFIQDKLRIGDVRVEHNAVMGQWLIDNGRGNRGDRSGMAYWGTDAMPPHEILSAAMNRVPPKIYYWEGFGRDRRQVFDPVATQAAQDKVAALKQAFQDWISGDPAREDAIATLYNDKLNRVVERQFDGAYLTTPGIASDWSWRPHQQAVVSRIIQVGNTYMAHAVGSGKTSAMIGAGMEMRRLGLVKKPMYVVPNHMLAQFAKEFYEQYPTARIMVADEQRFHTDRRRQFISDVAQSDIDGVIITHSGFGKIPISEEFGGRLIQEQIDDLEEALSGLDKQNDRITIKRLEKQKEKLEQRLSKATDKQDMTNTFEELGADFLFVDEAHIFRKLGFASKQQVKGITSDGSDMAWDLYTKLRYLEGQKPGRSAVFASGTPVTNTMGELYSISRYLQPGDLRSRGISHFDSWAQTFGDTKTDLEQTPAGAYAPVTRFSRFVNMPELYKMVASVMDIVTPSELEKYVTRPQLQGGARQFHLAPRTPLLDAYQADLAARVEAIKTRRGPPQKGDDILLSVINDGRHSAIDPRFVSQSDSDPRSKLNQMIENVVRIHHESTDTQFYDPADGYKTPLMRGPATQMIFANLGVNSRGPMNFSGYKWIRTSLIRAGIPAEQIAIIGDYSSHIARQALFNDMNEGKMRVLIGSSQKMGTGINAQRRLIALHNQDPLWFPADDEQRLGRIIRQGNLNPEVQVHDYSTKGTYDAVMWGMMGRKGRFIEQFFRGDPNLRDMEDLGEAGMYEQASAMATVDERVQHLTEMQQDLDRAQRRSAAHDREQYNLRNSISDEEGRIASHTGALGALANDLAQRVDTRGDAFRMKVGDETFTTRKDAGAAFKAAADTAWDGLAPGYKKQIAEISGFPVSVSRISSWRKNDPDIRRYSLDMTGEKRSRQLSDSGGEGTIQSAETSLRSLENDIEYSKNSITEAHGKLATYYPLVGKKFEGGPEIDRLRAAVADLQERIKAGPEKPAVAAARGFQPTPGLDWGGGEPGGRPRVQFSPRPVADVRGDELGGEDKSYGYRRTRGREALLAVMKQGPVENPQLGTVQFSGAGVGRTLRTFDSAKLALIPHLREIIAEGDLVRSAPSYKPDPNVRAYHTLEAPVRIGGVDHDARVVIREDNNGKFYYDIEKTEAPLVRRDVSPDRDQTLTQPASTEPLPRDVGGEPDSVNLDLDAGGADRPGKAVPAAGTVVDSGERSAPDVDLNLTQLPGDRSGSAPDDGLPLFSPRQRVAVYNERETEAWTPEQALAYSHVGRVVEVPTFRERLATLTNDLGRRTIRYLVDPYIGVKADDPAGYMALRNANTTAGATEMFLTDGTLRFNGSTYAMADRNGGVEHSLVRPLHGEQDRFLWWVAANRAERLTAEDRENLWSQDDIDTLKATNQGQVPFDYTLPNGQVTRSRKAIYLDSLRKLDGFNKNVLDLAEQSGLIGSDTVSELVANPFYVPFYRLAEDDGHFAGPNLTSGFVKQNAFKTLKGGTQKLNNDLWDNAIKNWSHMIDASLRNKAASGVLDTAVTNGAAIERSERELAYLTKADKKSTVWVMNNGRKQSFQISDPMLFTAISALEFNGIHNWAMDIMTKFKTILTQGVTADPRFMLRICIRDAEQAIATAPLSLNVAKNVYTGFGMGDLPGALTNVARAVAGQQLRRLAIGQEAADAIAGGATMRLGSGHDTGGRTTDLDTMLDSPKSIAKFWHWVSQIARAYKEVTAQGEDTQRFALYHKLIADGVPHDQASFAARDLEDFTLKGAGQIVRFLTQTVPFMNAWMQGLYKVGRSTFDQDRNFAVPVGKRLAASATKRVGIVLAASTLATLALDALYADDEDYKKRPEYDRNANFWFKFGGVQFRIPMGFEIAAIGRIAANGVEAFFGQNEMTGRRFVNNVGSIFMANMSMNPVPQIVRPLLDVYSNTSGTGAPIIGKGMDRLRSEEQYTAATTMPARWASSAANTAARAIGGPQAKFLAPIQIDYLVNGYFGWLGSHVVNLADIALRGADQAQAALRGGQPFEPVRPNTDLWNFATGGMVSTETTPQSRYVDMLYQQADGISRAYATYEDLIARGRVDDARDFYAANKHQIGKHQLIDKIEQVEQMANRQIKRTGESQTLSAEQKRIEIMKYNAMRNRAAENVFGTRPASAP